MEKSDSRTPARGTSNFFHKIVGYVKLLQSHAYARGHPPPPRAAVCRPSPAPRLSGRAGGMSRLSQAISRYGRVCGAAAAAGFRCYRKARPPSSPPLLRVLRGLVLGCRRLCRRLPSVVCRRLASLAADTPQQHFFL